MEKAIQMYKNGIGTPTIAKHYGVHYSTVVRFLRKNGVGIKPTGGYRTYSLDETYFDKIDTQEKAYFLGLMFADGYVKCSSRDYLVQLALKSSDKNLLESFAKELKFNGPIKKYTNNCKSEGFSLKIYNKSLAEGLIKHGCVNAKTFKLLYPKLSENLHRHFIRGYFDGDGSLYKTKIGRKTFTLTGRIEFLQEIKKHLEKHSITSIRLTMDKRTPGLCNLKTECRKTSDGIYAVLDWMYYGSTISLERKKQRYLDYRGGGLSL